MRLNKGNTFAFIHMLLKIGFRGSKLQFFEKQGPNWSVSGTEISPNFGMSLENLIFDIE